MPWSGGTFTRIMNWVDDKNANIPITASRMDTDSDDFTSGINNCIAKDGSNTPTSALNMGALRITNVGAGTALTDAATINQVQASVIGWGVAGGTADAITLTLSPAQTTIADGTLVFFRASAANATTAPTFAFNATTARTITRRGGLLLIPGDIPAALAEVILRYNTANTRWELLNPALSGGGLISKQASGSGVGNGADTTEDTLYTYSLPASALNATGQTIRVTSFGVTGATGDTKVIKLYFGSTVAGTISTTNSNANWRISYEAVRTGSSTQVVNALTFNGTVFTGTPVTSTTETDTNAIVIKVTGQDTSTSTANQIKALGLLVEFLP